MTAKRIGLPAAECRSLHVVARFAGRSRVGLDSNWPVLLDGLLAGVAEQRRRPGRPEVHDLPLARYLHEVGSQWSWLASVALPLGVTSLEWVYRWKGEPGPLAVDCVGVEWYAVGDADKVAHLLRDVDRIGNRHDWVAVAHWDVVDVGAPPLVSSDAVWLPSGLIARPIAARGAVGLGVPGAETVDGAVRPPYWRAPPTNEGDTFSRQWRPVIAPWTARVRS